MIRCLKSGNTEVDKEDQDIGEKPHPRIKIARPHHECHKKTLQGVTTSDRCTFYGSLRMPS